MNRPGITIVFSLALAALAVAFGAFGYGCCMDGEFWVQGIVVDRAGRAVPNVAVKARNDSTITDQQGCFQIKELTNLFTHEIPFSVVATGFKSYVGTTAAPTKGRQYMSVSLADESAASRTVLDRSPKPAALGPCEKPRTERRGGSSIQEDFGLFMEATRPDSLLRLRLDLASARVLVWVASVGRESDLTDDAHLFFFDRYQRIAACYSRRGNETRARRMQARAWEHLRSGGWDGPPYAAAMGMPRPRVWLTTDAVSRQRLGGPKDAA